MSDEPMQRSLTIRFSHIDGAGIVFYPRYFEMLSESYADLPFAAAPFAVQTDFLKPNYLGDKLDIVRENDPSTGEWAFTGVIGNTKHFSIASLPGAIDELDVVAHRSEQPAFQSDVMLMSPWATDCTGFLQVSRYYESLNAAVEQWFPRALDTSFHDFHADGNGMPTVVMKTRCRKLPAAGETVSIWIRPTNIGEKSLTYTSWMVRGNECLLETEQIIVFVKIDGRNFRTMQIPDRMRDRLQEQYVAT